MDTIFGLTPKGRDERAARTLSLPPELRNLLALVDGRRTRQDLRGRAGNASGLLRWLAHAGYIERVAAQASPSVPATEPVPAQASAVPDAEDDAAQRFRILSSFLTDAVKQHLGLRGFVHQLRIERAMTLAELAERVEPLADAIGRATDRRTANSFVETARALLELAQEAPTSFE